MFIRAVEHKNKKNRRKYRTYKLVDSVRTERGPRQITVLNLGVDFDLPKEDWKQLANCIEEIVTEQQNIVPRQTTGVQGLIWARWGVDFMGTLVSWRYLRRALTRLCSAVSRLLLTDRLAWSNV